MELMKSFWLFCLPIATYKPKRQFILTGQTKTRKRKQKKENKGKSFLKGKLILDPFIPFYSTVKKRKDTFLILFSVWNNIFFNLQSYIVFFAHAK